MTKITYKYPNLYTSEKTRSYQGITRQTNLYSVVTTRHVTRLMYLSCRSLISGVSSRRDAAVSCSTSHNSINNSTILQGCVASRGMATMLL